MNASEIFSWNRRSGRVRRQTKLQMKRHRPNTSVAVLLLLASCSAAQAAGNGSYAISCPATIETTQNLRSQTPVGWSEVSNLEAGVASSRWKNTHWLKGVSFSTGHPSALMILAPDNSNESWRGRTFISYWTFYDAAGVYVSCSYSGTTVELTQRVPDGFKRCEVRYEKNANPQIVGVSCSTAKR